MGDADRRNRIEIELVDSRDGSSAFARDAPDAAIVQGDADRPPAGNARFVLVSALVGVGALALGWGLGRSSNDGASVSPPSPIDEAAVDRSQPVESIGTAPPTTPAVAPSPIEPMTTSDVVAADSSPRSLIVIEDVVDVASVLQGQPIEIVAFDIGRQLFQLDLTTSRLSATEAAVQPFGKNEVLVAPDWVLLPSNDASFLSSVVGRQLFQLDQVDFGASWQVVGLADSGSVWWIDPMLNEGSGTVVQRRSINGDLLDEIVMLPVSPSAVDPAGGLIVELPGRVLTVRPEPSVVDPETGISTVADPEISSLTTGRLLALGADTSVVEECEDDLTCGVFVVDRATAERRPLARADARVDARVDDGAGPVPYGRVGAASVAPDGSAAAVELFEPADGGSSRRTLGVMDLLNGTVTEIGPTQDVEQIAWSPDGRFLLHIQGGRLTAFDTQTGESVLVADRLTAIGSFGIRAVVR